MSRKQKVTPEVVDIIKRYYAADISTSQVLSFLKDVHKIQLSRATVLLIKKAGFSLEEYKRVSAEQDKKRREKRSKKLLPSSDRSMVQKPENKKASDAKVRDIELITKEVYGVFGTDKKHASLSFKALTHTLAIRVLEALSEKENK